MKGDPTVLYSVDSRKTLPMIREDLPKACAARQFGVLSMIDLHEKLKENGVAYDGACTIFEVCNPHKAKTVLEAKPEISTVLPCRIAAYTTPPGIVRLSTLRPSLLLGLFGAPGLEGVAAEVEATLIAIMNEAAR
jgi:uncharacterized protein (DUF302 family)